MSELGRILTVLEGINEKLGQLVISIIRIDGVLQSDRSSLKDSANAIQECTMSDNSTISSTQSDYDQASQCDSHQSHVEENDNPQHIENQQHDCPIGLVLSDSELTFEQGKILNGYFSSSIPVVNYNEDSDTVKKVLFETNHDFVVIQDSGEAISQYETLDCDSLAGVQTLVEHQLNLARMVVRLKPDTQVFIGSLPPRVDTLASTQLAEAYNNYLVVNSFMDEKITVISQNGMYTNVKKKLSERFCEDGCTLTKYGTHLMVKNLVYQITDKIPRLKYKDVKNISKHGKLRKKKV